MAMESGVQPFNRLNFCRRAVNLYMPSNFTSGGTPSRSGAKIIVKSCEAGRLLITVHKDSMFDSIGFAPSIYSCSLFGVTVFGDQVCCVHIENICMLTYQVAHCSNMVKPCLLLDWPSLQNPILTDQAAGFWRHPCHPRGRTSVSL